MRYKHYPPSQPKRPLQLRVSDPVYARIQALAHAAPHGVVPTSQIANAALEIGLAQLERKRPSDPDPVVPLTTRGTDDAA